MPTRRCIAASLLLYAVACCLPAYWRYGAPDGQYVYGLFCLIALPFVLISPAWYANPLFFWGCIALAGGNARRASWAGLAATILALSFIASFVMNPVSGGELHAGA